MDRSGHIVPASDIAALPALVQRAADQLAKATTAAEVLDARDMASTSYDAAKTAARIARAKGAHDELIAKVHRAQADALEIEAMAKRRLADEYDAAQERGEVAKLGTNQTEVGVPDGNTLPTAADLGLSRKAIHEARQIRDAEEIAPGIVHRTVTQRLEAGDEPTKAAVREAILEVVSRPQGGREPAASRRNPLYEPDAAYDDALTITDSALQIAEAVDRQGPSILDALPDEGSRARAIAKIHRGRDALNLILEKAA
ncbi:MAG: hypothetical protein ACRED4_09520 [Brevundimonas sp.]